MTRSHKIISYDLAASFDEGSIGREVGRVIDTHGKEVLIPSIWSAGLRAYDELRNSTLFAGDGEVAVTGKAMADDFEQVASEIDTFLNEVFLPQLLEDLRAGILAIEPVTLNATEFMSMWGGLDVAERVELFLQCIGSALAAIRKAPEFVQFIKAFAAFATLARIDDARIAVGLGDFDEAMICSTEIERFRASLEAPDRATANMDIAVKMALSDRASSGGKAKYEKHNQAREFVVREWSEHRIAYGGNKSEFARHYVRRVLNEFGLNITEKTVREVWLTDTPPAS